MKRDGIPGLFLVLLLLGMAPSVLALDFNKLGGDLLKGLGGSQGSAGSGSAAPSESEVVAGLREALVKGSEIVVDQLGREDGFLGRPEVRIPLPGVLESVGKGMRGVGLGSYVDGFETSLNRAAEAAVPEALQLLVETVRNMSVDDAWGILRGPDDAATSYFRKQNEARLGERFLPIVREATAKVGVTQSYKGMLAKGGAMTRFVDTESLDIDTYVTGKAVNGLFLLIAAEEKRIRENPVARSSELLQKVFGSVGR